jgi:hypothetical protein
MKTSPSLSLGILCGFILAGATAHGTSNSTAIPESAVINTNAADKVRWTSYYISTNKYSKYLHEDFSYTSNVTLPPELDQKVQQFFQKDYKNTYSVLKLSTQEEDEVYDIIDHAYHRRELFNNYREYMEMLTELERMGSSIDVNEVDFKKITVKGFEDNILTVEAIWTVHGTLHHKTHDHVQKNANCVEFKVEVSPDNELKIKKVFVISIDRFNIYR